MVELTLDFYKRNYIEGLFLSSGIIRSPDYTMEEMVRVARTLRETTSFGGYIHLKMIPDAEPRAARPRPALYADRLSTNIELPTDAQPRDARAGEEAGADPHGDGAHLSEARGAPTGRQGREAEDAAELRARRADHADDRRRRRGRRRDDPRPQRVALCRLRPEAGLLLGLLARSPTRARGCRWRRRR